MPDKVVIQLSAEGAEAVSRVFNDLAKKSQDFAANMAKGSKQINESLGSTTGTLREASNLLGQAGVSTGVLGNALGALTSPLGLAAAGFVGLSLGIRQATAAMTENFKEVRQLQAVTGLSVEAADNLADTFKVLGVETTALTSAMFKMSSEIENGGETLRLLGIKVRDTSDRLKTEGDVFLEIRDRLAQIGSAAERNALGIQIFGRQFRELAPVFALSREEFVKFQTEASKLSGWTEESQKAAAEYTVAINKLSLAWGDFWNQAGVLIATVGTPILDFFTTAIQKTKEWGKAINDLPKTLGLMPEPAMGGEPFGGEPGRGLNAVPELSIKAQQALIAFQKQLDIMKASDLDQPIVKLDQALAEFTNTHGAAAGVAMAKLVDQMKGLERAKQADAAMKGLNATMGTLAQTIAQFAQQGGILASLFPPTADELLVQNVTKALEDARGKLLEMKDALAPADLANRLKVFDDAAAGIRRWTATLIAQIDATRQAKEEADAFYKGLAENIDSARMSVEAMEFSYGKWLATLNASGALDDAREFYKNLADNIASGAQSIESIKTPLDDAARATQAFQDGLQAIGVEAKLFGDRFDTVGATIQAMESRLRALAATSNGQVTPAMQALAAQLDALRDFQDLRGMFEDIFSGVGSAINTLVQGVILGTQTMAEAFKKLGQSIVIEFVNRVIQQALNPLVKSMAGVVAGLLSPKGVAGAVAAVGGGASGDGGMNSAGMLPGEAGGTSGFSVPNIPTGALDPSFFTNLATGFSDAVSSFNYALELGEGTLSAFSSGFEGLLAPFATGVSSLSVGLAGVGAALAVFGTVMDFVNGNTAAGVGGIAGGLAGAGAGALIGSIISPGYGTILGGLAGGALGDWLGSMLGGLFGGGPSNYDLKRIAAGDTANQALSGQIGSYQGALASGNPAAVLQALQTGGGGAANNSVRTELVLPSSIASQFGIQGQQIGAQVVAQWSAITLEQFDKVIALFKAQPDLIQGIRGSGDVPFLEQGNAQEIANQIEQGATALLSAFVSMENVKDQINTLAKDINTTAKVILPTDIAEKFTNQIVTPFHEGMLAVLDSGQPVEEMQKQFDTLQAKFEQQSAAWEKLGQTAFASQTLEDALPTDLASQFATVMDPQFAQILATLETGATAAAAKQQEKYNQALGAWAQFGQDVVAATALNDMIPDTIGEQFRTAMQAQYDKILGALVEGNTQAATVWSDTLKQSLAMWANFGQSVSEALDLRELLPTNLGDQAAAAMRPQYDKILAALEAGQTQVANTQIAIFNKQLADWKKQLAEWEKLQKGLAALDAVLAKMDNELLAVATSGDLTIDTFTKINDGLVAAVTKTQAAFDALKGGDDLEKIAASGDALFRAMLDRYNTEQRLIEKIKSAIAGLIQSTKVLTDLYQQVAVASIGISGDVGPITGLITSLRDVAQTAPDASVRLYAVEAGLNAIIAAIPAAVKGFDDLNLSLEFWAKQTRLLSSGDLAGGPTQITSAIRNAAQAFLDALSGEIDSRRAAGDQGGTLALLQQQAAAWVALAEAGVAAINQWADQAVAGAQAAAQAGIDAVNARRELDQAILDAQADALQAQIEAINTEAEAKREANDAALKAINKEIDSLQEALQAARQWEAAVKSTRAAIEQLRRGTLAPTNPMAQFQGARETFNAALRAFKQAPSAEGLGNLQGLAQTLLGLAEPIFTKPSPVYQKLFADILSQLEAAANMGEGQVPIASSQLEELIALRQEQAKGLADLNDQVATSSRDQIKAINAQLKAIQDQKGAVDKAAQRQIDAINKWLPSQIKAIREAADSEIASIQNQLIPALNQNATEQADIMAKQFQQQEDMYTVAVYSATKQFEQLAVLREMLAAIQSFPRAATGAERVQAGPHILHAGEMVVPSNIAARLRAVGGLSALARMGSFAGGLGNVGGEMFGGGYINKSNLADKKKFEALRKIWYADYDPQTGMRKGINPLTGKDDGFGVTWMFDLENNPYFQGKKGGFIDWKKVVDAIPHPALPPPPVILPSTQSAGVSGGPSWLTGQTSEGGTPDGSGTLTIVVNLDGKKIAEATLPDIRRDARSGELHTIIVDTKNR